MYYNEPDLAVSLRPPGHMLMLMVRASVLDAGSAGPWLTITKSVDGAAYRHHVTLLDGAHSSAHRLTVLTGDDVLAHALTNGWESLANPTRVELRRLADDAMEAADVEGWATTYPSWERAYLSPLRTKLREQRADMAASGARAMRWMVAESWLRGR